MSRKKLKAKSKSPVRRSRIAGEDRGSVALTVAWMMTALATAVALSVAVVVQLVVWRYPPVGNEVHPFAFVPGLFLMIATLTGLFCLILTPVVYRVRRDPPPRPIATGAVGVSLVPLAIIAAKVVFP